MSEVKDFWNRLDGKKTYVVMVATIVYAVSGVIIGQHDVNLAAMMILGALGLGGMRDAVRKLEK